MTHPANPHFAECVRASFKKQNAMHLIRATLLVVEHGRAETMCRTGTVSSSSMVSCRETVPA
jgi:hypothetical protein